MLARFFAFAPALSVACRKVRTADCPEAPAPLWNVRVTPLAPFNPTQPPVCATARSAGPKTGAASFMFMFPMASVSPLTSGRDLPRFETDERRQGGRPLVRRDRRSRHGLPVDAIDGPECGLVGRELDVDARGLLDPVRLADQSVLLRVGEDDVSHRAQGLRVFDRDYGATFDRQGALRVVVDEARLQHAGVGEHEGEAVQLGLAVLVDVPDRG